MGHCWANFSVIYGMTFGQEEFSVLICNNAVIWSLVNQHWIIEYEYCNFFPFLLFLAQHCGFLIYSHTREIKCFLPLISYFLALSTYATRDGRGVDNETRRKFRMRMEFFIFPSLTMIRRSSILVVQYSVCNMDSNSIWPDRNLKRVSKKNKNKNLLISRQFHDWDSESKSEFSRCSLAKQI